jgi:hypothetical protein
MFNDPGAASDIILPAQCYADRISSWQRTFTVQGTTIILKRAMYLRLSFHFMRQRSQTRRMKLLLNSDLLT